MDKLKYIVTDRGAFATFNGLQNHSDVARSLHGKPVGAGFIHINAVDGRLAQENCCVPIIKIKCYGRSVSLNLDSREEADEEIIIKNLN